MRGRTQHSSSPSSAAPPALTDAVLPEPTGPEDDRFVYELTPKALRVLAEHQGTIAEGDDEQPGAPLARPVARTSAIRDAIEDETRRQRRRRRTREARDRGRRFATVSHCNRDNGRQPYIRLTGQWLREAGFDLGTELEIDITRGRLTLEAFPDP
jgi:hypothetical protein